MLKKIVLGSLLLGLCGILVVGAIQRTTSRIERGARSNSDEAQGRQTETAGISGQRNAGNQAGRNQATETDAQPGQGRRGSRAGSGNAAEDTEPQQVLQVFAEVVAVDGDALAVETTDGDALVIDGRSWRFASDMGFQAQAGDRIAMSGFYEDGEWKTTEIENLSNGTSLILRADSGRPMWAGQGQQGL
ncbi:MAG: hypothetical protein P8Z41_00810 [Anaerolineales bacterium]